MMSTLTSARRPKRTPDMTPTGHALARHRAVMAVMLGTPPAAVAADLGCSVATLMEWVKIQRQLIRRASRPVAVETPAASADEAAVADDADDDAYDDDADDADDDAAAALQVLRGRPRGGQGKRTLPIDRQVAPENSELVEAAYRHAEFDYSGRRIRPVTH